MWSKDFKYKVILTFLFASGTVVEVASILNLGYGIANTIHVFFLICMIFNISDMIKEGYLWPHSYTIIGFFSIFQIVLKLFGYKEPVILSNILSVIYIIVFLVSVNYLSNKNIRNGKEERDI